MTDSECRSLAGSGFAMAVDSLQQIDRHLRGLVEPESFSGKERAAFREALVHLRQARELLAGLMFDSCLEKDFPP